MSTPSGSGITRGGVGLYAPILGYLRQQEPGTLLDIGTGNSMFLPAMKEIGWDVKGTEIDSEIVETFRDEHGIELGYGELEDIGYDDESFDAVTILGVLEHIRQPQAFMDEVTRILKPGGVLCLYIFNRGAEASLLGRYWGGFDVPRHLFSYSTRSLTRLLERSGLRVTGGHHQPISFLPFFLVWLAMRTRNRIGRSASATFPTSLPRPLRLLNTPVGRIMASMKHSSSLYVFARKPGAVPQPAGAGPA